MNYIYDILTNFNDELIDFFEWDKKDNIVRIKKIPIIKISTMDFETILKNNIQIGKDLLHTIYLKTDFWNNNKKKDDLYYLLISDGNGLLALKFNEDGIDIKRSSLMIEEELEVLEICERLDLYDFEYKIIDKILYTLKTRKEKKDEDFLNNEIMKLERINDVEKIRYLYFECYGKKENNIIEALNKLKNVIKNDYCNEYNKLYNFFKLTSINNK